MSIHTRQWQTRTRPRILERDGYTCQIGLPGCTVVATEVDHVLPRMLGGGDTDDNLRAACQPCNLARRHPRRKNRSGSSRAW